MTSFCFCQKLISKLLIRKILYVIFIVKYNYNKLSIYEYRVVRKYLYYIILGYDYFKWYFDYNEVNFLYSVYSIPNLI